MRIPRVTWRKSWDEKGAACHILGIILVADRCWSKTFLLDQIDPVNSLCGVTQDTWDCLGWGWVLSGGFHLLIEVPCCRARKDGFPSGRQFTYWQRENKIKLLGRNWWNCQGESAKANLHIVQLESVCRFSEVLPSFPVLPQFLMDLQGLPAVPCSSGAGPSRISMSLVSVCSLQLCLHTFVSVCSIFPCAGLIWTVESFPLMVNPF